MPTPILLGPLTAREEGQPVREHAIGYDVRIAAERPEALVEAWAISRCSKVGRDAGVTRTRSPLIGVIGSIHIRLGIVPVGCRGLCPGPIEMSFLATRRGSCNP